MDDGASTVDLSAAAPPARSSVGPGRGLTDAEVEARRRQGLVNVVTDDNRRTVADIVRANVLTRFNAILGTLLAVVLATGEYRDALFGIVLVTNALIGIVQELRAKATLDRLEVVSAPRIRVVRDSAVREVPSAAVVQGDVVEVSTGDQLPVDGVVLTSSGLEIDESLLTGESDPIHKQVGDRVLSGSFVVAGSGRFEATDVGDAAYATQLAKEAKKFTTVNSELRSGTNTILRVGSWLLLPTGILLVISQVRSTNDLSVALRASVAGVGAMIPEGLVLLTSVAFAVGATRLARRRALLQELPAVEMLARVDVVCVDKTGTLTEGSFEVTGVEEPDGGPADRAVLDALGALASIEERPNASLQAIAAVGQDPGWELETAVPFSSARKWSGATFRDEGSWVLGAPDVLLDRDHPLSDRVEALAATGRRVLLLARAGSVDGRLPADVEPVALVCLEERIRGDAADTIAYFAEQGVALKVISGDNPATVGAVAAKVGVLGGTAPVDARTLPEDPDELADMLEQSSVFGRVQPHQKRAMVHALQRKGHVVAMTGDGVNDVLALKDSDVGVAMGSGSNASRGVAQLVLLDDSFASLPHVVAEGRRVIGNVERVANLFVTKSVYALLLALAVGVAQQPFPFLPRHLTIISSLTIGIPAFFLALAPNEERSRPGFVGRVARFAIPAGTIAAAATYAGYGVAGDQEKVSLVQERTVAVIVLFLVAAWVLVILARPFNEWKAVLAASMGLAFIVVLATPAFREFFELELPPTVLLLAAVGVAAIAVGCLELGWQLAGWQRRRHHADQT